MDDAVSVTIVESTGDLSAELACLLLLEFAVGDDVVEHLTTVDILKQHVPVVVCTDDIAQATDMGVTE